MMNSTKKTSSDGSSSSRPRQQHTITPSTTSTNFKDGSSGSITSSSYQTPEKQKRNPKTLVRRRSDGSPIIPRDETRPVKTLYMIRHGQSQGQTASSNGLNRQTSTTLRDCDLTEKGIAQAKDIPHQLLAMSKSRRCCFHPKRSGNHDNNEDDDDYDEEPNILESIQLVISSPLTRALHTALVGFPTHDIIVHFDLREIGSKAPENNPRDMALVLHDLKSALLLRNKDVGGNEEEDEARGGRGQEDGGDHGYTATTPATTTTTTTTTMHTRRRNTRRTHTVDVTSLQPADWPRDYSPNVVKRDRLRKVLQWIYHERDETILAVVCHFNIIRSAICNGKELNIRPKNAMPLCCHLYSNGDLILLDDNGDNGQGGQP